MTKDSNTTVKGYKNAVQLIGYAAAYPAYPLNPPLPSPTYRYNPGMEENPPNDTLPCNVTDNSP